MHDCSYSFKKKKKKTVIFNILKEMLCIII